MAGDPNWMPPYHVVSYDLNALPTDEEFIADNPDVYEESDLPSAMRQDLAATDGMFASAPRFLI